MSIERLQSYYGFTRMPFGRGLAPAMLHRHPGHAEAVARITWCVDQHAIGVITGEVGAGKTVAIRAATAALDPARHVIIYLPNPSVGVRGMLHHIVGALGRVPSFYTATLAPQAADALAAEHAERGRTPVVVIDEAHLLDNAQMEAIRMLTNHDMDSGSPFAALLVGQPTLRQRLRLGVLAALDQRIAVRYALAGMTPGDTADYITHREHLAAVIADELSSLRSEFDVVVCEGAGSPAEINLRATDLANMGLARAADLPVLIVGDIDRGGVLAHFFGTVAVLEPADQALIAGFLVNKFRGDPALLAPGLTRLEELTGRPTYGVLPFRDDLWLDTEDSLSVTAGHTLGVPQPPRGSAGLDVAAVRLPRISNTTDLEALACEPGVVVRWVHDAADLAGGEPKTFTTADQMLQEMMNLGR